MQHFKNALFFYSSFTGKSGRIEYAIYCLVFFLMSSLAIHLQRNVNLDNEKILNIFYTCLIVLMSFVPMQAVTTRRLRDLNANPAFVIFNFIPILNIAMMIFLIFTKRNIKL